MAMKQKNLPAVVEVEGVHGYIDGKGVAWLNVEDVARGLGFVEVKKNRFAKSVDTSVDNHPTYIMCFTLRRLILWL